MSNLNFIRKPSAGCLAAILVISLFQLGTIRRKDDPLAKAQADPILFKEKMEQEKDGKKEAPMPSFTLYGKQKFLADSPVEGTSDEDIEPEAENVWDYEPAGEENAEMEPVLDPASASENIPETSADLLTSKEEEDWWSEPESPQKP